MGLCGIDTINGQLRGVLDDVTDKWDLRAERDKRSAILKAEGQSRAIDAVFQAVHRNDPDPKLLAYQYLQGLPELAKGQGNTF